MNIDLVRDCLDKLAIDRNGQKMGRIDGIIIEYDGSRTPRVAYVEVGAETLAGRLPAPVSRWLMRFIRKLTGGRDAYIRIPWNKVTIRRNEVVVDVDSDKTPVRAMEHWIRTNIIERIPGG